jgi:hypothetical protein
LAALHGIAIGCKPSLESVASWVVLGSCRAVKVSALEQSREQSLKREGERRG